MVDDSIAPLRIGWAYLEGYPWWPVYICDPDKLREQLHNGRKVVPCEVYLISH